MRLDSLPEDIAARSDEESPGAPPARYRRRERGQVLVLFALFLVLLLVLAGSAYDYGSIVLDQAHLQNAVDSATLAGANSLSQSMALPAATARAVAQATTQAYLAVNSAVTPGPTVAIAFPTSTPVPGATPSQLLENISVSATRNHSTYFWPLVGINQVTVGAAGSGQAARTMTDIMLSLDTTGSMRMSGTQDFPALRAAVAAFLNQVNPTTTDPKSPQVGIARFAGIKVDKTRVCTGSGRNRVCWDEETVTDDKTLLMGLSKDKAALLKIADNSGAAACPSGVRPYGCPLDEVQYNGQSTGTKLPNAITVLGNGSSYAWSTANGGRNNANGEGWARKVLVIMTDGVNEAPNNNTPGETPANYDSSMITLGNQLKLGEDGTAGTPDDVEIYVVGFFCTPYSTNTSRTPERWCKSRMAASAQPHPCPGPTWPPVGYVPTSIETLLRNLSSSSPGTCDRFYPIAKDESLPQLFQALAGTISRGRLTE